MPNRKTKPYITYVVVIITVIYLILQLFRFFNIKADKQKSVNYIPHTLEYTYKNNNQIPILHTDELSLYYVKDKKELSKTYAKMKNTEQKKPTIQYQNYSVPKINTSFKAYMDYRTLSNKTSSQYSLQKKAYTDKEGFRRIGQDYCIALGTYYSRTCGERFLITTESGEQFVGIIADIKDNKHTNYTKQYVAINNGNANVIEFIINERKMNKKTLNAGDISDIRFKGNITKIQKIIGE